MSLAKGLETVFLRDAPTSPSVGPSDVRAKFTARELHGVVIHSLGMIKAMTFLRVNTARISRDKALRRVGTFTLFQTLRS